MTLLQLYCGTTKYYTKGPQPLLNKVLYNALDAVQVCEDEASNELSKILQLPFVDMVTTVLKCSHDQTSFDSIQFLSLLAARGRVTRAPSSRWSRRTSSLGVRRRSSTSRSTCAKACGRSSTRLEIIGRGGVVVWSLW